MQIEIYGGEKEIGGNKILLKHKDTNIFLDFGVSFKQSSKYFSEFLQPRKSTGLIDFFEFGLLPDLKGIYRQDYLKHIGRPQEERKIDGVFLTHAHFDHAQYIHFLRKDIPIYCSEETRIILQSLEKITTSSLKDFTTICDAYSFYTNKKGTLSRVDRRKKEYIHERPYEDMEEGIKYKLNSLEIERWPVDHSLPGASAFIIYSDAGNLVYTGDIRFHGWNKESSEKFLEKAIEARPKWLICEGTRIGEETIDSEERVKTSITNYISSVEGNVFVEHPMKDIDRVTTIFQSAKANNRDFVVPLKLAFLIDSLKDKCHISLEDVKILVPKKGWGLIGKSDLAQNQILRDYDTWEREYILRENVITCEEIKANPQEYVVSMNFWEIRNLVDIQPKDSLWIMSKCEPFSTDMELDEIQKSRWLDHFGVKQASAHASGHASGPEIKRMIAKINPEILIPIHTEHPHLFESA